jgi:hypothetical protein
LIEKYRCEFLAENMSRIAGSARQAADKIIGTARLKAFAVPFERAFKASEDVRHLNVVVVVSCVNELSLLSGFLGRFFLRAAFFGGLFLSCHISRAPFQFRVVTTR